MTLLGARCAAPNLYRTIAVNTVQLRSVSSLSTLPPSHPFTTLSQLLHRNFSNMASSQASPPPLLAAAATGSSIPASRSRLPQIPRLLYGTAWKGDYTSDLVILALSHGFRGIDTAGQRKHYREDHVGQALSVAAASEMSLDRRDIWLQTKFTPRSGQDWSHPELIPFREDEEVEVQVRKSFAASLRNLHPWLDFTPLQKVAEKLKRMRGGVGIWMRG